MKPSDFTLTGHDTFFDLSAIERAIAAYALKDVAMAHPRSYGEVEDRVVSQILRLRWCEETCFSHSTWARFDFDTTNPEVLSRRIAQTQAKLARIASRYLARNKMEKPNDQ